MNKRWSSNQSPYERNLKDIQQACRVSGVIVTEDMAYKAGTAEEKIKWMASRLRIRPPSEDRGMNSGRRVCAHWRAGHHRHYRHERYERNADGSVRIEFIEPYMVHKEEMVEVGPGEGQ